MLVSRISRLGFRILELDLFEAQVLFRFCLITQRSLRSLPDLSRKIERFERLPFLFFTRNILIVDWCLFPTMLLQALLCSIFSSYFPNVVFNTLVLLLLFTLLCQGYTRLFVSFNIWYYSQEANFKKVIF